MHDGADRVYSFVDTVFVSRFGDTDALSAINICTPVIYIIVGLASMLATGASAIIGRKMGEGDGIGARQTMTFITVCCAALSVAIMVAGLLFWERLLYALGANERLMGYCKDYILPQFAFAPAICWRY